MKFNKWTVGLAAVGAVSLASVAQAEERAVMSAMANTTLSGYVDTSMQWNVGGDTAGFPAYSFSSGKQDGFNLNVVNLTLEKPLDESELAAGYKVELLFGPDATGYNASANADGTSDFGVKQAYVQLRAPIGNGIDFKIGTFDTIIGYEVMASASNPNFTRSYGYSIEPTQHTGVLASYKFSDYISASAGVANTLSSGINTRPNDQGKETYMGSVALTAPDDWGFLAGSALYAGAVAGFGGEDQNTANYYVGAVLKTPVTGLTAGLAWDYVNNSQNLLGLGLNDQAVAAYAAYLSYQIPDSKLSLHTRGEFLDGQTIGGESISGTALTGTVQYDLWANVVSRLEARWDHSNNGDDLFGNSFRTSDAYTLLANVVYKF